MQHHYSRQLPTYPHQFYQSTSVKIMTLPISKLDIEKHYLDYTWLISNDTDVPIPPYLQDTDVSRRDITQVYSNVVAMDQQVGQILAQLEEDGLLDSTIIFWYTDHGGPLPRQKRLLYDSGIHVPLIIRFPDKLRAGEIDDQLISFVDFKSTVLSLAGICLLYTSPSPRD